MQFRSDHVNAISARMHCSHTSLRHVKSKATAFSGNGKCAVVATMALKELKIKNPTEQTGLSTNLKSMQPASQYKQVQI